jgi:hypothetical protein
LSGASTKQFWDEFEQFGEQLEELGIGDEGADNVYSQRKTKSTKTPKIPAIV